MNQLEAKTICELYMQLAEGHEDVDSDLLIDMIEMLYELAQIKENEILFLTHRHQSIRQFYKEVYKTK